MKLINKAAACLIAVAGFSGAASAQSTTVSSTGISPGYSVTVNLLAQQVIPDRSNCSGGYNYNVRVKYTITVNGTMPGNLYDLQGTMSCVNSGGGYFPLPRTGAATGFVNTNGNAWRSVADCNTATPSSLNCNAVALTIEGPGISRRTINMTLAPLPVVLSDVKVSQVDPALFKLDWATAEELNNNFFTVEKSTDGKNWTIVETVKSKNGNISAPQEYSSLYKMSREEMSASNVLYFRLLQTDMNGSVNELKTISILTKSDEKEVIVASSEGKTLVYTGEDNCSIEFYSMDGRKVYSETKNQSGWTEISNSSLTSGIFFVKVSSPSKGLIAEPVKVLVP